MKNLLYKIIPAITFIIIIAASITLAIIGFFIFWYVLVFVVFLGAVFYIYAWLKYKVTGKKPNFASLQDAINKANKKNKNYRKKRTDYSKPDNSHKETIDQEDIDK